MDFKGNWTTQQWIDEYLIEPHKVRFNQKNIFDKNLSIYKYKYQI